MADEQLGTDARILLMAKDMEQIKEAVERIDLAISGDGNGRKGIVRDMDAIKVAIAFNNTQTIAARVERLEGYTKAALFVLSPIAVYSIYALLQVFADVVQHVRTP